MSGKKRFEPEKITAALKMLRSLPIKDARKTAGEALLMLKGGIQDALDKGYDRREICKAIAAADLPISPSTFYDFVAEHMKESAAASGTDAWAKQNTNRNADRKKSKSAPEQAGKPSSVQAENPMLPERKAVPTAPATAESVAPVKQETPQPTPAQVEALKKMPSYFTPDLPDSEL